MKMGHAALLIKKGNSSSIVCNRRRFIRFYAGAFFHRFDLFHLTLDPAVRKPGGEHIPGFNLFRLFQHFAVRRGGHTIAASQRGERADGFQMGDRIAETLARGAQA